MSSSRCIQHHVHLQGLNVSMLPISARNGVCWGRCGETPIHRLRCLQLTTLTTHDLEFTAASRVRIQLIPRILSLIFIVLVTHVDPAPQISQHQGRSGNCPRRRNPRLNLTTTLQLEKRWNLHLGWDYDRRQRDASLEMRNDENVASQLMVKTFFGKTLSWIKCLARVSWFTRWFLKKIQAHLNSQQSSSFVFTTSCKVLSKLPAWIITALVTSGEHDTVTPQNLLTFPSHRSWVWQNEPEFSVHPIIQNWQNIGRSIDIHHIHLLCGQQWPQAAVADIAIRQYNQIQQRILKLQSFLFSQFPKKSCTPKVHGFPSHLPSTIMKGQWVDRFLFTPDLLQPQQPQRNKFSQGAASESLILWRVLWHNPYSHQRDAPNLNVNIRRSRCLEENPWPRYHPSLLSAHHLKDPSEICLKPKLKAAILEIFGHGTTIKIWKCAEAVDMFVEGLTVPTIQHRVSEIVLLPNHLFRTDVSSKIIRFEDTTFHRNLHSDIA